MPISRAVMDPHRILIVDETFRLAQDLMLALRRRPAFQILGPVHDETAASGLFGEGQPDMVVVQLDRIDGRGVAIVSAIRAGTKVRVMAATRCLAAPEMELALAAGACGVLPTDRDPTILVSAFRRAAAGELVLPVDEQALPVDRLMDARTARTRHALLATLTQRECEVMAAMADGATTTGIALELGISPATVQSHVKNILAKLGVHSKVEAVGVAWRSGLALGARSA